MKFKEPKDVQWNSEVNRTANKMTKEEIPLHNTNMTQKDIFHLKNNERNTIYSEYNIKKVLETFY